MPGNNKPIQLDIINKSNPMQDDYHIGIRSIDDIKTPQEALKDEETLADVSGQLFGNQEFINIQINFISSRVK